MTGHPLLFKRMPWYDLTFDSPFQFCADRVGAMASPAPKDKKVLMVQAAILWETDSPPMEQ